MCFSFSVIILYILSNTFLLFYDSFTQEETIDMVCLDIPKVHTRLVNDFLLARKKRSVTANLRDIGIASLNLYLFTY